MNLAAEIAMSVQKNKNLLNYSLSRHPGLDPGSRQPIKSYSDVKNEQLF